VFCEVGDPRAIVLAAAGGLEGADRYSREVSIDFGRTGHIFTTPGEYRVRAVYVGSDGMVIPSPIHRLRVSPPMTDEDDRLAQDYFSAATGLCMVLGGSRSDNLRSGRLVLEKIAERCTSTLVGSRVAGALAAGLARPFFTVEPSRRKLQMAADADPAAALALTEQALAPIRDADEKGLNIAYHDLIRQRAPLLVQDGKKAQAKREAQAMRKSLAAHGANEPVLAAVDDFVKGL